MESHWGWNVSWHFSAFIEQLKIFPAVWSSKLYDLPLASLQTRALCWDGTFSACLVALTLVPPSAVGAAFQPSSRGCFLYSLPVPPKAQLSHRISVWPGDPSFPSWHSAAGPCVLSGFPSAWGARFLFRRPFPGQVHFRVQPAITFPVAFHSPSSSVRINLFPFVLPGSIVYSSTVRSHCLLAHFICCQFLMGRTQNEGGPRAWAILVHLFLLFV